MARLVLSVALCSLCYLAVATTDVYTISMTLRVPQVVNNSTSMGRRVYKVQRLVGTLEVVYNASEQADVSIISLTNRSFKASGKYVTYKVYTESSVWNLIGSNSTATFSRPSVFAEFEAQPSYVSQYEPTNDNSLILSISGRGSNRKKLSGYVTGTLGCGCSDYGHVSPTRVMGFDGPLDVVHDVASVYGTWRAKRILRK